MKASINAFYNISKRNSIDPLIMYKPKIAEQLTIHKKPRIYGAVTEQKEV